MSGACIDNIKLLSHYLLGSSKNSLRRLMVIFSTNKKETLKKYAKNWLQKDYDGKNVCGDIRWTPDDSNPR